MSGLTFHFRSSRSARKPTTFIGKVFTTLFLSVFVVAGVFFSTMVFSVADPAFDQQGWIETPATILTSSIEINPTNDEPYIPTVKYQYTYNGQTYTGSTFDDNTTATRDYQVAQDYTLTYREGEQATVYVNPEDPNEAELGVERYSPLAAIGVTVGVVAFMVVWFSIFSGIPLLIIIGLWLGKTNGDDQSNKREERDAAARRTRGKRTMTETIGGTIVGLLFGGIFTVLGTLALVAVTILPLWQTATAQTWSQVPCTIERSEVLSHSDSDGTTYSIDILYFYEVNGQRYGSNRYSFASLGSSSGRSGKASIVAQHPVGYQTTCFVHPNDPTCAVLKRGLTLSNLWGLFPLPFVAIGLFVLYATFFGKDRDNGNQWRVEDPSNKHATDSTRNAEPVVLKPTGSRIAGTIGWFCISLFWNGIVSIFLFRLIDTYLQGDPDLCLTAFLTPFVLIGLGMIFKLGKSILVIFAPKIIIELDRRTLPIGSSTRLHWHLAGNSKKVTAVTITLIGEESATYRRGTDTITDTEVFYKQVLFDSRDQAYPQAFDTINIMATEGKTQLAIPQDTMHSFEGDNNKITWKLEVKADVPRWPDPKDSYDLTVLPMPTSNP